MMVFLCKLKAARQDVTEASLKDEAISRLIHPTSLAPVLLALRSGWTELMSE